MNGITIVIPAYNEEKFLPETLGFINRARAAFTQKYHLPTELIVVDNASTDKTSECARDLGAKVILHHERNISSVRNAGIREAKWELVCTVDADTYVPLHCFLEIWKAMEKGIYVGGGVRLHMRTNNFWLKNFIPPLEAVMVKISGISAGLFFFKKDHALSFGAFPESYLIAEDTAFARLLKSFGARSQLTFLNLRTVTIETFDRKNVSVMKFMLELLKGLMAAFGYQFKKERLEYWYRPNR